MEEDLTSRSIEVLSRSSLSPERNELMLKTIRLWFSPSGELPNRLHFCLPDFTRSHITISPLHDNIRSESTHVRLLQNILQHTITKHNIPKTAGHNLWRSPFRPVDRQPKSFLQCWINSHSSSLQEGKFQRHYTWKETHGDLNDTAPESYNKPVCAIFGLWIFLCHLCLWLCSISAQSDLDYPTPGNTPLLLLLSPNCFHLRKESRTCHLFCFLSNLFLSKTFLTAKLLRHQIFNLNNIVF